MRAATASSTSVADLDVVLDPTTLAEAVGRDDLRVTRLRHKPGEYTVAALAGSDGPWGWVRVTRDPARVRGDVGRAKGVAPVEVRELADGLWSSHGPLATDPRLVDHLRPHAGRLGDATTVRHNPLRRLVLRSQGDLVRVSGAPQPGTSWLTEEVAADLVARPLGRWGDHLTRWQWVQGDPLDAHRSVDGAVAAGRALARWHGTPLALVAPRVSLREPVAERLGASAADLARLDRDLGRRMGELVDALPRVDEQDSALLHGDFSADQVVVGAAGARLVDLDRVGIGDPVHDLASFAAVEALRTDDVDGGLLVEGLRAGYAELAAWPARDRYRAAQARALLSRAAEPLRRADPAWRDGIRRTLDLVDEVLR